MLYLLLHLSEQQIPEREIDFLEGMSIFYIVIQQILKNCSSKLCRFIPQQVIQQSSCSSTCLLTFGITKRLHFSHSGKCKVVSISFVIIIGISLITNEIEVLFIYLLVFQGSSFISCVYPLLTFPLGCCLFLIDLYFPLFRDTNPFFIENMSCKYVVLILLLAGGCGCPSCCSGNNSDLGLDVGMESRSQLFIWLWFLAVQVGATAFFTSSSPAHCSAAVRFGAQAAGKGLLGLFFSLCTSQEGERCLEELRIPMILHLFFMASCTFKSPGEVLKIIQITWPYHRTIKSEF